MTPPRPLIQPGDRVWCRTAGSASYRGIVIDLKLFAPDVEVHLDRDSRATNRLWRVRDLTPILVCRHCSAELDPCEAHDDPTDDDPDARACPEHCVACHEETM